MKIRVCCTNPPPKPDGFWDPLVRGCFVVCISKDANVAGVWEGKIEGGIEISL